jgi:hypothetical protein
MIVKTIVNTVEIHDHTIAEIFCEQGGGAQAGILGHMAKITRRWDSPRGNQFLAIGDALQKMGMTDEVKSMLQEMIDHL